MAAINVLFCSSEPLIRKNRLRDKPVKLLVASLVFTFTRNRNTARGLSEILLPVCPTHQTATSSMLKTRVI
jgi:hypothetical protein